MSNILSQGVFAQTGASALIAQFVLCIVIAIAVGVFYAYVYSFKSQSSQSFMITLALLPAIVCVVIMMVNGNIGVGVAVAGAFSLIRFRSIAGTAKEIGMLFMAMATGLIIGMGYIGYAVIFAIILGFTFLLLDLKGIGFKRKPSMEKILRITIPEDLDFNNIFDDLLEKYTSKYEVVSVKTSNMGSLFKLTYNITLKDLSTEKEFIDALRCRNGNLEISISKQENNYNEL